MRRTNPEQWAAASGFGALVAGVAAAGFERPWPTEPGPAFVAFLVENRGALAAQSMLFIIGSACTVWFLASLRTFLARAEGASSRSATLAFGAGLLWAGINMIGQAPQLVLTLPSAAHLDPGLARLMADLCFVTLNLANLPLAVMLAAVAAVSLRTKVLPVWLGWLSVVTSLAALALFFAVVQATGPLAPQGWLTLALYPASALWLIPTTVVMIRRLGTSLHPPRGITS